MRLTADRPATPLVAADEGLDAAEVLPARSFASVLLAYIRRVTSFDLVREMAGESAGPDLVAAVEGMDLDHVDALAGAILDSPRTATLPERPVTEIWPLVPLRASLFFDHANHSSPATSTVTAW